MRVLLVNDTPKPIADVARALRDAGHEVQVDTAGLAVLLRTVQASDPEAVVIDVDSPSRDTLAQLALLHRLAPRPVVVFAGDGGEELIGDALDSGVAAYVVDGLSPARLEPILRVAVARFERQARARQRVDELERQLGDRRDIERAKGLLMDRRGMGEAEAYAALRQQAMKQGLKLGEVARRVVEMVGLVG